VKSIETLFLRSGLKPWADLHDLRRLRARLQSVDIVHVHRGKEHWLAALANRFRARPTPLVRTRHIVQPLQPHALNRWLYGHATDLLITVSEAIARQCRGGGLAPPHRVVAIPGGADGERFQPASDSTALRRRLGIDEGTAVIGVLSGFRIMKGHGLVVEAVTRLAAGGRPFHLVFAGQGPYEAAIRQAVETAGLSERASFLGFVEDPAALLAALDIALYPPLESDGMSRALFEYLAAGRAVVASRVGVAAEILTDGRDALLVPGGDAPELAAAIARLLDRPTLRAELGQAAARLAHGRLTGARVAERLVEHYRGLLAG
jgi:glycosyltransferase involved in cell wall biosynthesis